MDPVVAYTLASVSLVSAIALVGIFTLSFRRQRLDAVVTYLVSFAAGALFGDVFLHILPEHAAEYGFDAATGLLVLGGVFGAFLIEKYVFWHHHHFPVSDGGHDHVGSTPGDVHDTPTHEDAPASPEHAPTPLPAMILFGDSVHNAIDGVIIAASYLVSLPLGVATTVAIAFHEIPQEVGDFGVLLYGGLTRRRAIAFNFLTALTAFVGAGVVLALGDADGLLAVVLPLAAGNFIYIAGSDLLPELKAEYDPLASTMQLATFVLGIGILYVLTIVG